MYRTEEKSKILPTFSVTEARYSLYGLYATIYASKYIAQFDILNYPFLRVLRLVPDITLPLSAFFHLK